MINVLDSSIYNRISAGEVVERPASVVKELVENAIDAGATHIRIEIIGGGIDRIRVIDDGKGIDREELKTAFLPHATSKISCVEDLYNIETLGFRGEALASIAAVSRVTIKSKTKNAKEGGKLHINGGVFGETTFCACMDGTEVIVENLFFNTPARAKFLKKPKSEENDITDMVSRLMLANPNIAFTYSTNTKKQLVDFGLGIDDAILGVYGKEFLNYVLPIEAEKNNIKLKGYTSKPNFTKSNRTYQTVIVNGRYVSNQTISTAIANAYQHILVKRLYPAAILYIELSNDEIDVNVHPNKTDVKFLNTKHVYDIVYHTIYDAVTKAIQENDLMPIEDYSPKIEPIVPSHKYIDTTAVTDFLEVKNKENYFKKVVKFSDGDETIELPEIGSGEIEYQKMLKERNRADNGVIIEGFIHSDIHPDIEPVDHYNNYLREKKKQYEIAQRITDEYELSKITLDKNVTETPEGYYIIGQIFRTYLILEFPDFVAIIDQHAAHERLLFDDLCKKVQKKLLVVQPLIIPEIVTLSPIEYNFVNDKLQYFKDLGIEIEGFGSNSFKISALPLELAALNLQKFFDDVLVDMNALKVEEIPGILREKLAKKACKSAIKAGEFLSEYEIRLLVDKLNGNFSLRCPHGRPIAIKITKTDIEKWFKRIV